MNTGKSCLVSVRVSEDFANWLNARSELSGMSTSQYVRYILEDFKRAVEIAQSIEKYNQDFCSSGNESPDLDD